MNSIVDWVRAQLGRRGSAIASGSVYGGGTGASIPVTFPPGLFTAAPNVVASLVSGAGAHNYNAARIYNVTTSGCTLFVSNGANATYHWIAVQS